MNGIRMFVGCCLCIGMMTSLVAAPQTWPALTGETNGVRTLFYEGEVYRGKPTRVFAYLGLPKGASAEAKVPGIVLVHGGGGSAFFRWVKFWNDHGYAAISMDTCGCVSGNAYGREQNGHRRHEWAGPCGWGGFTNVTDDVHDQWPHHAVSAVLRARALLASLPEVEATKIGITGVSWGGYLTCAAASLEPRFAFAMPVYGCGSLISWPWVRGLAVDDKEQVFAAWQKLWDPINVLPRAEMPMLWLGGSNDFAYPVESVEASLRAVKGPCVRSLKMRLPHYHGDVSENAAELVAFADACVRGGDPLPTKGTFVEEHGQLVARFGASPRKILRGFLDWTEDGDIRHNEKREWFSRPAAQRADGAWVAACPPAARLASMRLELEDGLVVSSDLLALGLAGAKWICQDAAGQPDWPMEGVSWLTLPNGGTERRFTLKEVPATATLAAAGFRRLEILVNGKLVQDDVGEWFNPSHLKFTDVASALKVGENTILVRPVERAPGCDRLPTHGVFILTLDAGDVRLVSDATWSKAKIFSPANEIPFGRTFSFRHEARSPAFRKVFTLASAPKKATLRITAPGFYEAALNGRRVGDRVLDPSPTDYDKRVYYSTYDVTAEVRAGDNMLEVLLGHGWYDCVSDRTWNFDHAPWRSAPTMIARLDCEFSDGTVKTVVSDPSWEQIENPVLSDNFRIGESATGACGGRVFGPAIETTGPKGVLEPAFHHPTKIVRELSPVGLKRLENGDWRVTFGENFTGWVRTRLHGLKKGDVVTFVYDECLDEPRALAEFQPGVQTVRYVAGGAAEEMFEPRFTYYGFRFVTIRGLAEAPRKEDFTGCFVRTSFPKTGRFICSNADFNELFAAAERSYEGNFTVGFPTDCPHREKNGWTADAAMAVEFGLLDYDTSVDYRKWLQDLADAQLPSGALPAIVPTGGWGSFVFDGCGYGPVWDSAPYAVAHGLWRHRADRESVRLAYPMLVRHFRFAETQLDADGLIGKFYGDHSARNNLQPDNRYCCTVYHLFNVERLAELAAALGEQEQAAECRAAATRLRQTLVRYFYRGDGVWDDGRETAQALAVDFALAPESEAAATAAQLVRAVEAEDGHFSFGITGSRHLLRALSKIGRADLAFAGLVQKTEPSPLLWLKDGGGTLWESWNGKASRNHIMFGDYAAWAYAHLAGITPLEPGYAKIRLAPELIANLENVEASVETPHGVVVSSWTRDAQGAVNYRFTVPDGVTAEIVLPGGKRHVVTGGTHVY